jgi:hypothetical protein
MDRTRPTTTRSASMRSVWRSVTVVGIGALLLAACGGPAEVPVVEATEEAADDGAAEESESDADAQDEAGADDGSAGADDGEAAVDPDASEDVEAAEAEGERAAAVPDADLVAAPCAAHEGRELEAFIDLVAPVDEQAVGDEVEIVGCSNVHEATVNWRLLDGGGRTLDEGFTTAECGTGCVGAFRATIPLTAAAGEPVAELQVYWISPKDGSDVDLVERTLVLG